MLLRDSYFRTQMGINLFWAIRSVDGVQSINQPPGRGARPYDPLHCGRSRGGAQTNKALRVLIRNNLSIRVILRWFDL